MRTDTFEGWLFGWNEFPYFQDEPPYIPPVLGFTDKEEGAEVELPDKYQFVKKEDDIFAPEEPEIGSHVEEYPNFTKAEERLD